MADEEIGLRLSLKDRRETLAGLESVERGVADVGREAQLAGRRADLGSRGFDRMGRAGRVMGRGLVVGAAALTGAGYVAFNFAQGAIDKASDLSETVNKSNVIFGRNAAQMRKWARSADMNLGLAKEQALGTAATFGDMFSQIGFTSDASARMSKDVVQMAADFGSFNNLDTADVLDRISASFRGEFDSLQAIIPNINAARVQQEAMNRTGKDSADQLTAQEKALATLAILHKDGARAMGDFERTSDGLANQQKIVNAQFENASAKLGRELLPLQLEFTRWLSREGVPMLDRFAGWFSDTGLPAMQDFAEEMRPLAEEVVPAVGDALFTVRDALKDAAPYARDIVGFFNDMPDWTKKGAVLGGLGLMLGGRAMRGLRGSQGGGLTGLVSKASPVPVFVVNNGPDGIGGGKTGRGGRGVVPAVGGPLAVGAGATALSVLGTMGIMDLFERFAPDLPQGMRGTPNFSATAPGTTVEDIAEFEFGTKVDPWGLQKSLPIVIAGLKDARTVGDELWQVLFDTDKVWTPLVDLNTQPARSKLTALQQEAANIAAQIASMFSFNGSSGGSSNPVSPDRQRPNALAHGGRVRAGETVLVGEHRAELFRPDVNGTVLPRVPEFATEDLGVGGLVEEFHLYIDGQEIKDMTVRRIGRDMARQ